MSEIVLKLFSFWGVAQWLYLMGSLAAFWVVLYWWLWLWHKTWAAEHRGKVLLFALIPTLPMLWANHAAASAEILQKSPRILENRVKIKYAEKFCTDYAKKCSEPEQFKTKVIPKYADELIAGEHMLYLPMDTTADYVPTPPEANDLLTYVYTMRNSAESPFADKRDRELLHKMVVEYMAKRQLSEENKKLLNQVADYSPYGWFAFLLAIVMCICARLAYKDINEHSCYPYRKR